MLPKETDAEAFQPRKRRKPWSMLFMIMLACTLLNVALAVWPRFAATATTPRPRRPSTYIGLDSITRNATSAFGTITNFARLMVPISASEPARAFGLGLDDKRWRAPDGTIYPELFHLRAAAGSSTVVQFRVLDFAMEDCALALMMGEDATGQHALEMDGDAVRLRVWELALDEEIDERTLSWSSRPRRTRQVEEIVVERGRTSRGKQFRCPAGALLSFELECVGEGCLLDFWQSTRPPYFGLALIQDSSL